MGISLTGIFVYPVKSLRGVALQDAVVAAGRLRGDREWLLLNADSRFMHQRDYPQMARLRVSPTADGLVLGTAGQPDLLVTRPPDHYPVEYIPFWRRRAPVRHVASAADAWLTAALGVPARLMAFAPEVPSL